MMINYFKSLALASVFAVFGGIGSMAYAEDPEGFVCKYPTSFKDTLQVTRQDRGIAVTNNGSQFGFTWGAKESYSDIEWHFKVNLDPDAKFKMNMGWIRYDDDLHITINGVQVFSRVGGGTGGYTVNQELGQFFRTGENTMTVRLVNTKPTWAEATLNFSYSEGGCTPIDYTVPVCTDGLDGDACIDKLNNFCAEPKNAKYSDCIEWKRVQNEVQAGANNSGTSSGTGGAGVGAGGGGGIMGNMGNISTASNLMFSPSAFAAQQAIGMIQQFFTCKSAMSEEEKALPNRLNARLCIYVGEYCSKEVKILGATLCRTKKKTYCCFNSTLARIINSEGNKQLGRGMGNPENATCYGFTIDEFNRLDLSRMDLSEFVAEVTKKVNSTATKDGGYWAERNEVRVQNTLNTTNAEDLQFKLLTADDPYSVLNQPTDGKAKVNATTRIVADETEANTPTAKETGISNVTQADKNQAKNNFLNHSLGE